MVVRRITRIRTRFRKEAEGVEKSLRRKKIVELETEIIASLVLAIISGFYILLKFGDEKVVDTLFLWLFPASLTILITLFVVLIIEVLHNH